MWKRDARRHSFGSYRMEQTKNEEQVALEIGNSPKVVKDRCFEIVDEKAASEYWSTEPMPRTARKIVAIRSLRKRISEQLRCRIRTI